MFKFSHLPLTVPPIGSLSNHTVLIAKKKTKQMKKTNKQKKQESSYFFRQIGIQLREAGTDEVIGRTGGGGFRLHLQECVPRPQRDLLPLREPGCGPQLAPGSSHQSWDLGIHSYGRRAAAGPRCACWTQTSKRCHALLLHTREARGRTQGPRLAQRCDKPRCLSADRAEATHCGPRRHAPPAYTRPVLACTQSSAGFPSPAVQEGGCWAPIAAGW